MTNSVIKIFLIRATIIFVAWKFLYHGIIVPEGTINSILTNGVISHSTAGLNLLGYNTEAIGNVLYINDQPVVSVADQCNGLELHALFIGFLIAFPGRIVGKLIFIPIGIIIIYFINILREIALALNYHFFQATFEINHKYTYVFIVYLVVFILWRIWLKRFSHFAK